jgi:hypothetical protein
MPTTTPGEWIEDEAGELSADNVSALYNDFVIRIDSGQFVSDPFAVVPEPATPEPETDAEEAVEEEELTCYECDETIEGDSDHYRHNGNDMCAQCYEREHMVECADCEHSLSDDDSWSSDYDGRIQCHDCHYSENEGRNEGSGSRDWSSQDLPEFQSEDSGEFITSTRIFSAELECYTPNTKAYNEASKTLPKAYGVSGDGSLGHNGVEFQTPKLKGKNGEESIKETCATLNELGFTVNASAGLHVHLDGAGFMADKDTEPVGLKNLLAIYLAYEDVLLSFLPKSRRGNRYCDNLGKNYHIREVLDTYTIEDLEKLWYRVSSRKDVNSLKQDKYHASRYNGVNIHSLLKDGHLEIRYHSGTLNATKILEWVNLHQTIMDKAAPIVGTLKEKSRYAVYVNEQGEEISSRYAIDRHLTPTRQVQIMDTAVPMQAMSMINLSEKTDHFFDFLGLNERARAYFKARQETFTSDKVEKTEANNLDEVCAG